MTQPAFSAKWTATIGVKNVMSADDRLLVPVPRGVFTVSELPLPLVLRTAEYGDVVIGTVKTFGNGTNLTANGGCPLLDDEPELRAAATAATVRPTFDMEILETTIIYDDNVVAGIGILRGVITAVYANGVDLPTWDSPLIKFKWVFAQ